MPKRSGRDRTRVQRERECPGEVRGSGLNWGEVRESGLECPGEVGGSILRCREEEERVGSVNLWPTLQGYIVSDKGVSIRSSNQTLNPNSVYCTVSIILVLVHLQIRELIIIALHDWFIIVQLFIIREHIFQHLLL